MQHTLNRAQRLFEKLGSLPAVTDHGAFPLVWYTKKDRLLCAACATAAMRDSGGYGFNYPVDCFINEDDGVFCEYCSKQFGKA